MSFFRLFVVLQLAASCGVAQHYTPSQVFAHNDYVRERPFYTAHELRVGYIEADVFLENGQLLVAHHVNEIVPGKDLEELYLKPLSIQVRRFNGSVYPDTRKKLTLMIDLKTEGVTTMNALVDLLRNYPDLIACPTLEFMISGNVPDPGKWKDYPPYIYFDGRPGISYTKDQLERISMISTSFSSHVVWDGRGKISEAGRQKIATLVEDAHSKHKKFRFWATPDFKDAWEELIALKMDVIVTDDVKTLVDFLDEQK